MTVGIMDVAAVCAVTTCGMIADDVEVISEAPSLVLLSMDEIYEEFGLINREVKELEREVEEKDGIISDLEGEVKKLNKEAEEIDYNGANSDDSSSSDTSSNSSRDLEVSNEDEHEKQVAEGQTFEATYYSAFCPTGCTGKTATGHDVSSGIHVNGKRVIAVDPGVIPLESTVKVTTPNETFEATALDTGGDIKGNRIDILVGSTEEAYSIGRHDVTVEIIE